MDRLQERIKLAERQAEMLKSVDQAELDAMAQAILDAERIFVSGWGRAGNNIKILSMNCSQIGLKTHVVGDNSCPSMNERDILIIGSGSGGTKSMLLFAGQAKSHGSKVGLIVGKHGSELEKIADYTVHIEDNVMIANDYCPPEGMATLEEQLVQSNAYYPVMQSVCDTITAYCADKLGVTPEDMGRNHNNIE
ncbi:MAG: SIS domain-containing protein [Clostridiales bacterium]|nr:SIS domain-containing protein [Clostridiales bacterium]